MDLNKNEKTLYFRKLSNMCSQLHEFKEMQDRLFLQAGQSEEKIHKDPKFIENIVVEPQPSYLVKSL